MSLSKQLLLLLSLIFFIIFSASLFLSISNIKSYQEVESQFHVQDTANSLGLSLSPHMKDEQDPILHTMMAAIFDTGYYQEMRLVNIENEQLVHLQHNAPEPNPVPQWFIDLVPMQTASAVAEINSGWHMTGKLTVTANPSYSYVKLYTQAKSTLWVSLLIFAGAILLLIGVLRFTLKPLREITRQAEQISAGHFTTITQLPWTREVKHVALSMNSMSDKIGQMIGKLNKRLEIVSESLKRDPLTQLFNQATFDVNLKQALANYNGTGYAVLIKFDDLGFLSREKGNEAVDNLLREFAAILRSLELNTTAYRLQGSEFAVLFPGFSHKELLRHIEQLKYDINVLGRAYDQEDLVHIGVIHYERSSDFNKLYPAMVEAYEHAKNIASNAYYIKEDLASPLSDIEWKNLITGAIDKNTPMPEITFTAEAYDFKQVPAVKVMEEAFTQVKDDQGNPLAIGTFFSMAQEFNLVEALDQTIIEKVIGLMETTGKSNPVTINLSMDSINSHNFNQWLKTRLAHTKVNLQHLAFSVTAYSATKDIEAFSQFAQFINDIGATVLLKRYSPDIIDIEQLKTLNINYLRLARSLTQDIAQDPNKIQFLDLISEVATLLEIKVLAEQVTNQDDLDIVQAKSIHGISR